MAETLEDLIDKATDPSQTKDGVDYSTPVCDRINLDLDGPTIGIRYIVTKVKSAREDEALLGLDYDGDWTAAPVKKRIIQCMYSWTVGLPTETKIAEAYKMLKTQGIVTTDPQDPYAQTAAENPPDKSKDTIFQDEEKSKLLARLLKSSHPEDLQAANRLIKTMVRQDEMKMERLVKRNTEMETCCNNIKLLTEMLNHYSPSSPAQDKELMKELYDSCDKMRPQLFRLASSATEDGDEGLAEILRVNDDLSRVLEYYKRIFGELYDSCDKMRPQLFRLASSATEDGDEGLAEILRVNDDLSRVLEYYKRIFGVAPGAPTTPTSPGPLSVAQTANSEVSPPAGASTLIDLGTGGQQGTSVETPASSVLENELKALGLHDLEAPSVKSNSQIPLQQATQQQQPSVVGPWGAPAQNFGILPPPSTTVGVVRPMGQPQVAGMMPPTYMVAGQMNRMPFQAMSPGAMTMAPRQGPLTMGVNSFTMPAVGSSPRGNLPAAGGRKAEEQARPPSALDLLGQELLQTQKQQQKQKQTVAPLQEKPAPEQQQQVVAASTADSLLSLGVEPSPSTLPVGSVNVSSPSPATFPPVPSPPKPTPPSLDNVFVPLDTIKPGNHPPLTVLDKNSIKLIFHFAKTSAELDRKDLLVVVISTMSSLSYEVKNFVFQAAVPKTMKVKLQPPSGSELPAYNPILPPSAITQVMLIANPAREKIRLKFKISYQVDGASLTETGEVDSFPSDV
ncbi:ADP-ribosylation factor-binding protein GGA1 [Stylophora pistillata]|uniref:ADP-ribosylation factor-binding protein GGA1 n=1 Tax=Stylophora pistillata TaxID=50429 RepID=A0A2B4RHJ9_STYPI|nr:ADP-ribosylation factor-binding protein GGA1 [Stylophora pistillata]